MVDTTQNDGLGETSRLLIWADKLGLKNRDIAQIIGRTEQRISDYRRSVRMGSGPAMPVNNRRVLDAELRRREAGVVERGRLYPSQQTAIEHDHVEQMSRLTGARGPIWRAYQEMVRSFIRVAEETYGETGPGDDVDRQGGAESASGG